MDLWEILFPFQLISALLVNSWILMKKSTLGISDLLSLITGGGRLWGINLLCCCCCSLLWYQHGRNTNRQILKPWPGKSSIPLTVWLDYYSATISVGALWDMRCDAEEVTLRYCHPICDTLPLGSWQNKMMNFSWSLFPACMIWNILPLCCVLVFER